MKNSAKILLVITGACLCLIAGIFIGRNMLPNYFLRSYTPEETATVESEYKININTASADALTQLPGIGQTTAERIIEYRNEHGSFQAIEELLNVKGIGYGTLYEIHELITTGG